MNNQNQNAGKIREAVMKELGLEKLSQEKQEELIAKMGEVVLKKMFLETVEKLDGDGRKHFERMLEEKRTPEEIEEFLKVKIPDYDEILKKIVMDLKEDLKKAI